MRTAIVGAGLAGLTTARSLAAAGHQVTVFEKSRGPSGRMSTRRTDDWFSDHGAQYFTARTPAFQAVVNDWIQQGVAAAWTGRIRALQSGAMVVSESVVRYVGAPRMTSPASFLVGDLSLYTEQTVVSLQRVSQGWQLQTKESGNWSQLFDAVVLAIPSPQVLAFEGLLPVAWTDRLRAVSFRPCWAVMARYEQVPDTGFDGLFANDDQVSWVSWNQSKPGRGPTPVAVIHATAGYTAQNLETPKEQVIRELTGFLSQFDVSDPVEALGHRWLYALSDDSAFASSSSPPTCLWDPALGLGLCGDYLAGGRVEGAFISGTDLAKQIAA
jgi:renalase